MRARKQQIKPLNKEEQKFCEAYIQNGCNAAAAARSAGRESHMGMDFIKRNNVAFYLQDVSFKAGKELGITFNDKANVLWDIVNDIEATHVDKIRAIDCLNKMQGHYKIVETTQDNKQTAVFFLPSNKLDDYRTVDGELA
jgi:phage terminase small subunit